MKRYALRTCLSSMLSVVCVILACTREEQPFPQRRTIELENEDTIEVLATEFRTESLMIQYVSVESLSDPEAVARHAERVIAQHAGAVAEKESLDRIELRATEWRDDGLWRAHVLTAERDSGGEWHLVTY